ncbi:MAG TPA: hypothetical protein VGX68_06620 [Thermoanaerobaculia bacterium]|nr:hypothetical protein [Thermoanaerobaculia bacterium]
MKDTVDHGERLNRFLEELPREWAPELLHLLDCPICRGAARERLENEPGASSTELSGEYLRILAGLEKRVPALVRQMEEQSAEARRLMDRLLASSPERQTALARKSEFGSLQLAELLLQESASAQPEDAARGEGLARLALVIAEQPRRKKHVERVGEIKARALALLGNARRLQKDLLQADERFRQAAFHLTGPMDGSERALYCQMLAALRRDQHREDEAAGLLWRAARIYGDVGDILEEGACLAELGFLLLAAGQLHEAVPPLARACPMLDFHRDAALGLRARLALAVCYAGTGHGKKARALVTATRALYGHMPGSQAMAEAAWMEGKVALLTGKKEEAAALLETARKAFLNAGNLFDAALASLDLILALPEERRPAAVHPLLHEISQQFSPEMNLFEVVKALTAVEMAVAGRVRAPLEDVVAVAAERLRRVRRYPQLVSSRGAMEAPCVQRRSE